ncbi:MAG: aldolase/citrate lyase family protein [Bacteroidales bacterium]|jgi:citrate lyase subunit beta/citryl-CoA lyase|nr:aldolase/citrate lyase family protein [Bacteroidales bacterium]
MSRKLAIVGNSGPKIRSDCQIELEICATGGLKTELFSKVGVLYGESIREQCISQLEFFGISNAILRINDSGALPFVMAARLEAAIKKIVQTDLEFLPGMSDENMYPSRRDRFRFARLYVPGNTPSMMINAGLHSADGIILDLEDSVAPEKKDEAVLLVRNALRQISFNGAERMVRINQGERGMNDLEAVVPQNVHLILIPKCESVSSVTGVDDRIKEIKKRNGNANQVFLMPIIETALGVEMAFDIARSTPSVVALAVGLEDLTADMGVVRTREGRETFYARTRVVNAARAAGIQAIDSVFSDVGDMDALRQTVRESKALGFEGMGCIHPRQVPVVKKGFAPETAEIERSKKIVLAYEEARLKGEGVVALGTKMIDAPVVRRALRVIELSVKLGLLSDNWMELQEENKKQTG